MSRLIIVLLLGLCSVAWIGHERHSRVSTLIPDDKATSIDPVEELRRRPVRLVLSSDGRRLLVANRVSGSISVVDTGELAAKTEWKVAKTLGDLVHWRKDFFLASDEKAGQLICIELAPDNSISIVWRFDTIGSPGSLLVDDAGDSCFVGGSWSRRLARYQLPDSEKQTPSLVATADLSFAIGNLLLIPEGDAILAGDAFGGEWSTFHTGNLAVVASGELAARRFCGAAVFQESGEVALLTQPLNRLAQAVRNDVHWGLVVANELVMKEQARFLDSNWKEKRRSPVPFGGPGEAKGDPESITFSPGGESAISLGGVNQVAIGDVTERAFAYVDVGRRPVDCCFSRNEKLLYVANRLDDTVSVIDVSEFEVIQTIHLGESPPLTEVDLGERLFHDATLSHDSWMSCHSCHVEGHTSGLLNDNFSDQSFGSPKRVLSLLGHGDTAPFAWNGSAKTLEQQVENSISITMQSDGEPTAKQISAIAAYIESLPAPPALAVARQNTRTDSFDAGKKLFDELGCVQCHPQPLFTSPELRMVGLQDELGNEEFNPPSLIGVSQRQRLMHDGRFVGLRDLFEQDKHQLGRELSDRELKHLLEYLFHL